MEEGRVPDAELEVLACLQRRGSATAREIGEAIEAWRPLSHSSVMTLLGRLEGRGLVRHERSGSGREHLFFPTTGRDEALRPILGRLVKRIFGGDAAGLVASLYGGRTPTESELDRLERLVRDIREQGAEERSASPDTANPPADGEEG